MVRKIIHIDMDAFYASIEQRDNPVLHGKPIAVGGSSRRGVVMTASYEARQFGVRSAMPVFKAQRLCPDLIIVRANFDAYKQASRYFRAILERFTDRIEPLSLDEAFIDVTECAKGPVSATSIAEDIRSLIQQELAVTASAGVSYNKFLAKLASGMNKPNGVFVIRPDQAPTLLAGLAIERFHGVGPATAKRLQLAGIHKGADLLQLSDAEATRLLGSQGLWFRQLAAGIDDRSVSSDRARKSLSIETTFGEDIDELDKLVTVLDDLSHELVERCKRAQFIGRTLTLKLKYRDFQLQTRSQTPARLDLDVEQIQRLARLVLLSRPLDKPVRLIGLGVHIGQEPQSDDDQLPLPFMDNHNASS